MPIRFVDNRVFVGQVAGALDGAQALLQGTHSQPVGRVGVIASQFGGVVGSLIGGVTSSANRTGTIGSTLGGAAATMTGAFTPAGGTINVSNVTQLMNAVAAANAAGGNRIIVLADGTYTTPDALHISSPNVTIRSASGIRENVIIQGDAISGSANVPFNVRAAQGLASGLLIRDVTLGGRCRFSALQIEGLCNNGRVSNCVIRDSFEHLIKGSATSLTGTGTSGWIIEDSLFMFTAGMAPAQYNGGIDCHLGVNWSVWRNTFRDIASPITSANQHAVNFWNGSTGCLVERNKVIDCDRGIGDGLSGQQVNSNNTIRNNQVYHSNNGDAFADVGIIVENSTGSKVYNNTVYLAHGYPNAIEYRFTTTGTEMVNNLTNKPITARDGGTLAVNSTNSTNAQASYFVDLVNGDLNLASAVSGVVDAGTTLASVVEDFGGTSRPQGSSYDRGSDEYSSNPLQLPLLQLSDLTYLGSFTQPTTGGFFDMQQGMGMDTTDPTGSRMYIGARSAPDVNFMSVARINIPTVLNGQASTVSVARVTIPIDVSGGDSNGVRLGNSLVVSASKIVVSSYAYYYNGGDQPRVVTSGNPATLSGWTTAQSYSVGNRPFADFLAHVPAIFQSLLGGPHAAGGSAKSIISNCNCGVGLAVGDLNLVGAGGPASIPMTALANFVFPAVMGAADGNKVEDGPPSPYFNARCHVGGVGFATGYRTMASVGSFGTGTQSYLQSPSHDPCTGFGGVSAYPYIFQVQLFDVADLAAVKAGTKSASSIKPYAYGALPGPTGSCRLSQPGSGCYDPVRKRFYITEQFGGTVHAWGHP